jgi:hypothetical protein
MVSEIVSPLALPHIFRRQNAAAEFLHGRFKRKPRSCARLIEQRRQDSPVQQIGKRARSIVALHLIGFSKQIGEQLRIAELARTDHMLELRLHHWV